MGDLPQTTTCFFCGKPIDPNVIETCPNPRLVGQDIVPCGRYTPQPRVLYRLVTDAEFARHRELLRLDEILAASRFEPGNPWAEGNIMGGSFGGGFGGR